MPEKAILLLLLISISLTLKAQTPDAVYERYLDFNLARLEGKTAEAFKIAEGVKANVNKLPAKSRTSFYNGLAKLYEDDEQSVEAIPLYEKVAAAEPNYYVVHRALGYLYLKPAAELYPKLQSGGKEVFDKYKVAVVKALPHLEKAQACDPSDETLALIKKLYANIKDDAGLKALPTRLSTMSNSCVDILSE
jgi:tetratricopeptide (TPR) repeat protein